MEEDKMSKQTVSLDIGYSSKKEGKSNAILLKLRKERMEWDTLPVEVWHQKREEIKPIMDEFFDWCCEHSVLPDSKLGKAIGL